MAFTDKFYGQYRGQQDGIRPNPGAPNQKDGPPPFDGDLGMGANPPNTGSSQPGGKKSGASSGELPLKSARAKPNGRKQVLMAHALRNHSENGTTFGTAIGGGAAGGGAGE